jgi:site-specific DNA recombinase
MIEAGEADVIVVPRWSRFTRNLRDYVMQTARIESAGGRVESAQEETDPATSAGLLQRDLFAILAQWESRKIGEAWRETHQRRRRAQRDSPVSTA